jgi:hypothetical protein
MLINRFREIPAVQVFRVFLLVTAPFMVATVVAQDFNTQPSVWSAKPDIAAFDKSENVQLAAAQHAIDTLVAVKGPRTIENTLAVYDEAVRHINSALRSRQGFSRPPAEHGGFQALDGRGVRRRSEREGAVAGQSQNRTALPGMRDHSCIASSRSCAYR